MRADTVIILSHSEDIHSRSVAKEIETTYGRRAFIWDTAWYPTKWRLSVFIGPQSKPTFSIQTEEEEITGDRIAGVWWRRPQGHTISKTIKRPEVRKFCLEEARTSFRGWIASLGQKVINPFAAESVANHKPFQLAQAASVGLSIPDTIITNNPSDAGAFIANHKKGTIFKALTGTDWQFTETRKFRSSYTKHLAQLLHAPAIFQELVEAGTDLRVTIVDHKIFAVSIHPQHPGAKLDWRLDVSAELTPYKLPDRIGRKLLALMKALGLRFGAVDMRVNPKGDHVFLEINPGGQWLFCEIHGGQPISKALAYALLHPPKKRLAQQMGSNTSVKQRRVL